MLIDSDGFLCIRPKPFRIASKRTKTFLEMAPIADPLNLPSYHFSQVPCPCHGLHSHLNASSQMMSLLYSALPLSLSAKVSSTHRVLLSLPWPPTRQWAPCGWCVVCNSSHPALCLTSLCISAVVSSLLQGLSSAIGILVTWHLHSTDS